MKAVGYAQSLPIEHRDSLIDIELPEPVALGHDLLVKIRAIAVNPVDYKIRQMMGADEGQDYRVLGWDAVGEVIGVGEQVTLFQPGDDVYYAGEIFRQGCNAEYQLVDERIVGRKPATLSDAEAAALPLTTITAWELLFEHLEIPQISPGSSERSDDTLLIVGAAGGVGSILTQIAAKLTGATIIGTASREATKDWVTSLGAHHVVDHSQPLKAQVDALEVAPVSAVASLNGTDAYFDVYEELLVPFGRIAMIDDPEKIDITKLKFKSLSLHWEFMFARSLNQATDMIEQHKLLNSVAQLVDAGHIRTTASKALGPINATNLRTAHQELEAGTAMGKMVLEGF